MPNESSCTQSGSHSPMTGKDRAYTWSWRLSPPGLAEDSSQTARLRVNLPFPAPDWGGKRNGKERKIKKKKNQKNNQEINSGCQTISTFSEHSQIENFKSQLQIYSSGLSTLVPSFGPLGWWEQSVYFGSKHQICVDGDAGGGEYGRIHLKKTLSKLPIALRTYKECTSKEEKTTQMDFY